MARDMTPRAKRCRRLGLEPSILGYTKKPSRRAKPAARRASAYAQQLTEKQKVKYVYGVLERQFRRVFERAAKGKGKTGETLLALLESRLDNVAYRLAWAKTRREARQLVSHGRVRVNGKTADIPSMELKPGDVVSLRPGAAAAVRARHLSLGRSVPGWLSLDVEAMSASILEIPPRSSVDFEIREHMIVELYSK